MSCAGLCIRCSRLCLALTRLHSIAHAGEVRPSFSCIAMQITTRSTTPTARCIASDRPPQTARHGTRLRCHLMRVHPRWLRAGRAANLQYGLPCHIASAHTVAVPAPYSPSLALPLPCAVCLFWQVRCGPRSSATARALKSPTRWTRSSAIVAMRTTTLSATRTARASTTYVALTRTLTRTAQTSTTYVLPSFPSYLLTYPHYSGKDHASAQRCSALQLASCLRAASD
jgi:hypothetical protein